METGKNGKISAEDGINHHQHYQGKRKRWAFVISCFFVCVFSSSLTLKSICADQSIYYFFFYLSLVDHKLDPISARENFPSLSK